MNLKFFWIIAFIINISFWCQAKVITTSFGSFDFDTIQISGIDYFPVSEFEKKFKMKLSYDAAQKNYELKNSVMTIKITPNKKQILINNVDSIILKENPIIKSQQLYVPASILNSLGRWIERLSNFNKSQPPQQPQQTKTESAWIKSSDLQKKTPPEKKEVYNTKGPKKIVVIDPGHGGAIKRGAEGNGLVEKELVLDISKRVRKILANRYKVLLTRESDVDIDYIDRSNVANKNNADLFISIHANAAPLSKKQNSPGGFETFYLKTTDSTPGKSAIENFENSAFSDSASLRWRTLSYKLKSYTLANHIKKNQEKSEKLANIIQNHLAKVAVGENRGVKSGNFAVLRFAYCPSCLVEVGFVDNDADARKLSTAAYRQNIAQAIANGIIEFLK